MKKPTDFARARRERELDERLRNLRPALNRGAEYLLARGIDPARAVLPPRALAVWSGRPEPTQIPRAFIF